MKHFGIFFVYLFPIFAGIGLVSYFSEFDPSQVGPLGMLGVFLVIYLISLDIAFLLAYVGLRMLGGLLTRLGLVRVNKWSVGVRRAYYISSIVAFGPVFLLAINTLGQLHFRDLMLVIMFLSLAIFYVARRVEN
jgi:hypothetical protein